MILVTGATGMLGRSLCETLSTSHRVAGVSKRGLEGSIACDLSDEVQTRRILEQHLPKLLINTAAYSDVDGCERDPKLAHDSNVGIPKILSILCAKRGIPWIHVSTDYVFSGKKEGVPYIESDTAFPKMIYGLTKWAGEHYVRSSGSPSAVVRTSWLFGAAKEGNFVNHISEKIKTQNAVSVLDNQVDAPTSVKDLSLALKKIGEYLIDLVQKDPKKKWNEIFHVCNSGSATHYDMALKIRDVLGLSKVRIERMPPEAFEALKKKRIALRPTPYIVMSNEKFQKFFGMRLRSWQESLAEYVNT